VLPTVHYNMGGIPTNYHGEVLTKAGGDPDTIVPGLMAVGEAACVSVHGANRLGSNSLIDLVVFGRAAGLRCGRSAEANANQPDLPKNAGEAHLARFDKFRNAKGGTPTAKLRATMQKAMQEDCAVFRTGETLQSGVKRIADVIGGVSDIGVTDRGLIWNTDLVETLEFDNLIVQAAATVNSAPTAGKPRRPRARRLPRARRRELDEAHAGLGRRQGRRHDRLPPGARLHDVQRRRVHQAEAAGLLGPLATEACACRTVAHRCGHFSGVLLLLRLILGECALHRIIRIAYRRRWLSAKSWQLHVRACARVRIRSEVVRALRAGHHGKIDDIASDDGKREAKQRHRDRTERDAVEIHSHHVDQCLHVASHRHVRRQDEVQDKREHWHDNDERTDDAIQPP
jgi:hypothetical protein